MKRPESAAKTPEGSAPMVDAAFLKNFPTLVAFLADTKWDDGTPRETGSLSVFIDQGRLKISVNDRDLNRSAYVTAEGLMEGLKTVERGLSADSLEWRLWGKNTKKK